MLNNDNRFDIDLRRGNAIEASVVSLLLAEGPLIEIKSEFSHWRRTGNVAVEFESRGKPSGLAVTQAQWWVYAFIDDSEICALIWLPIQKIKDIARYYYTAHGYKLGGDNNTSKLILVPISELVT